VSAGNENRDAVFSPTEKPVRLLSALRGNDVHRVYGRHQEILPLQERHWESGIGAWINIQKHFVFAEKFILERKRNRSNDISMTNDTSNLNRLRSMSQLFVFPLVIQARLYC
jgi:hypothetical protein